MLVNNKYSGVIQHRKRAVLLMTTTKRSHCRACNEYYTITRSLIRAIVQTTLPKDETIIIAMVV